MPKERAGLAAKKAGVSHFLMLEDPEQFNPVLVETLASFER